MLVIPLMFCLFICTFLSLHYPLIIVCSAFHNVILLEQHKHSFFQIAFSLVIDILDSSVPFVHLYFIFFLSLDYPFLAQFTHLPF